MYYKNITSIIAPIELPEWCITHNRYSDNSTDGIYAPSHQFHSQSATGITHDDRHIFIVQATRIMILRYFNVGLIFVETFVE